MYQTMLEKDRSLRLLNQRRLRQLKQANAAEVDVFSAHDIPEFRAPLGRSAAIEVDAGGARPGSSCASWEETPDSAPVRGHRRLGENRPDGRATARPTPRGTARPSRSVPVS
jgi:hypothetical protein